MQLRRKSGKTGRLGEKGGDEEAEKVTLSLLLSVPLLTGVLSSMRVLQGTDVSSGNKRFLKQQD
jgi:hypothetical protein